MRVVAIDGPAGAGKSTIAKALALRLGVPYLDTGAMYRAVTYAVLRDKLDPSEHAAVGRLAQTMVLTMANGRVAVDVVDVTDTIRGTEVTSAVSIVAAISEVRQVLREQQRDWVRQHGGGVVEGRDIGTVVFPDATLKVYLTASPEVRAQRRVAEAGGDVAAIAKSIAERDRLDSTRADSPLYAAADSAWVDTSDLDIDQVVSVLYEKTVTLEESNG